MVFGLATLVVLWLVRRAGEADTTSHAMLDDYVDIAYLRGGPQEAMRVATLNLVNRGLLEMYGDDQLQAADKSWAETVSKPIERRLLGKFRDSEKASTIFSDAALMKWRHQKASRISCASACCRTPPAKQSVSPCLVSEYLFW